MKFLAAIPWLVPAPCGPVGSSSIARRRRQARGLPRQGSSQRDTGEEAEKGLDQ